MACLVWLWQNVCECGNDDEDEYYHGMANGVGIDVDDGVKYRIQQHPNVIDVIQARLHHSHIVELRMKKNIFYRFISHCPHFSKLAVIQGSSF